MDRNLCNAMTYINSFLTINRDRDSGIFWMIFFSGNQDIIERYEHLWNLNGHILFSEFHLTEDFQETEEIIEGDEHLWNLHTYILFSEFHQTKDCQEAE